jgi:hypothetical protein
MKCKNCSTESDGKYCPNCGQELAIHRVTVPHLLHEIVHTFTHLEKGFLYTLKKLLTDPGRMQRDYLEGFRAYYQKPFSMFFICATISALSLYWINRFSGNSAEGQAAFDYFLQHYYVLLHIILLPLIPGHLALFKVQVQLCRNTGVGIVYAGIYAIAISSGVCNWRGSSRFENKTF